MQLWSLINLWEYHHKPDKFYDAFLIDERLDKDVLFSSMMYEIGELEVVDCMDWQLWYHFDTFFKKWKIPIEQLLNSIEYGYNPMLNMEYRIERNLGRNVVRDLGRDIVRNLAQALTGTLKDVRVIDTDTTDKLVRDKTDNFTGDLTNAHNDTTTGTATGTLTDRKSGTKDTVNSGEDVESSDNRREDNVRVTKISDSDTTRTGTENWSESGTVRHYVSAFNQVTPEDADTYSDRDTSSNSRDTTSSGSENTDVNETSNSEDTIVDHGTKNYRHGKKVNETTEDEQNQNTSNNTSDVNEGGYTNNIVNKDIIDESVDSTGTKDTTDTLNRTTTNDRSDDETTNTSEDETTRTDEDEGTHKVGIDRITYQELIESQRKVVQFNIYNWIIDKVAKEFTIGVW